MLVTPPQLSSSERRCRECSHSWEHHRGGICAAYVAGRETEEGIEEIMCGCKCVFPAADAGQGEHQDLLRDAGAIVCVNDPDVGARVEIRFAELGDAQRLHKALTQSCANSSERCCAWTLTEIDNPWYQTACGRETDDFDGGYCAYCGGVIKIDAK